ncbi:hypothetical protein DFP72DRAFT_1060504 [Ephemerocybe angulata]|uniref:Uncharacterized protein n=1 Tax=Ephemerocybe angulata TaxID=980116 RepID=A0A8H6IF64_9AGAR|nr:hypothetical protein DFP72DRAFT_1060504 [Tulosesus angulatus]
MAMNFILGVGMTVHDERLHPPWAFRGLLRLFLEERGGDFDAIMSIASDKRDPFDQVQPKYHGNWWLAFTPTGPKDIPDYSPLAIVKYWEKSKGLTKGVTFPRYTALNLSELTEDEFTHAFASAADALRFIESEISNTYNHLVSLSGSMDALKDLSSRIMKLESDRAYKLKLAEAQLQ